NMHTFQLKTALKPVKALKLSSFPEVPTLINNKKLHHNLQLTNMTSDKLKVRLTLPEQEGTLVELSSPQIIDLSPNLTSALKIDIQALDMLGTGVLKIPVNFEINSNIIIQENFFVFLSRDYQISGHCNSDQPATEPLFLQNSFVRVNFNDKPPFEINRIDNLVTGHFITFFGLDINLGPPYEGFMNEWQSPDKTYNLTISKTQSSITLTYRARSSRFPVILERSVTLYAGLPGFKTKYQLMNTSEKGIKFNLKTSTGVGDAFSQLVCPLKDGLVIFNKGEMNYPEEIKNPGDYFHENWCCQIYTHGMNLGVIWEDSIQHLSEMIVRGQYTEFRWEDISLEPKNSVDIGITNLVTTGSWDVIRGYWLKETGNIEVGPFHNGLMPRESVDLAVFSHSIHPSIIRPKTKNINIRLTTEGKKPINGNLHFNLSSPKVVKTIQTAIDVENVTIDHPFEKAIPIRVQADFTESVVLSGSLKLETRALDIIKTFKMYFYPEKKVKIVGPEILDEERQYKIDNGYLMFNADTAASINFLNTRKNSKNLLESQFPKRNVPFVFFNPFIGGIIPLIRFFGSHEKEILVQGKARFQIEKEFSPDESGSWYGINAHYTTTLPHPDIDANVRHITLPGVNFIKSCFSLENNRDEFLLLRFGFFVFLTAEGGEPPKAEVINPQGQLVQSLSTQYTKLPQNTQWLQMTTIDPDIKLGFISDDPTYSFIDYFAAGDKVRCVRVYMGCKIEPHGKAEITMYTVLLKENEQVTDYLFLREWNSSKYIDNTLVGSKCLDIIDFPVFYD
ncbi:MAG: hypothetical protein ACFFBD_28740, partial [Candidatus Hodarchaeota archaeon]